MTSEQLPFYIGRYLVTGRLGSGGMGVVYLATDERLNRRVAIKRLLKNPFSGSAPQRIRQEALLLAQLNHANIVQIYDVVDEDGEIALVMEYVDGCTLAHWQRERNPTLQQKIQLLRQICQGLARAHSAGIIHRDLKADNILIDSANTAKISDFGIAKNWREDNGLTRDQHVAGSWGVMSPEQALGKPLDNRSDLFALGVLAYQLLCEQNPFGDHESPFVIVDRIVNNQHPPAARLNPDLPPALCQLLDRLLEKEPQRRPINANAVAAELETVTHSLDASRINFTTTRTVTITAESFYQRKWCNAIFGDGKLLKIAVASCSLLATVAALYLLLAETHLHLEKSGNYIAVISPTEDEGGRHEETLLRNNVLSAIKQGLSNRDGLFLVPYSESHNTRGQPLRQQAQALNAQLLLNPSITCGDLSCEVSLELIDSESFSVIGSRSTHLALDESLESRARTLQQLNELLPHHAVRDGDTRFNISASAYQRYLELFERRYDYLNLAETLDELDELQEIAANFPPLYELYGELVIDQRFNDRDESTVARLDEFLRRAPHEIAGNPELLTAELRLAIHRNDTGRAEALLQRLKLLLPDQASYYHLEATYYHHRGDYDQALSAIDKALALRTSYTHLLQKALTLTLRGDMPAAKPYLLQAQNLSDNNIDAISLLAANELDSGRPQETIRLLAEAGLERIGPMATYNLCLAYYIQREYPSALQCFDRASALAPADADPLLYQAEIARELQQEEKARQLAQRAVELTRERDDWEGQLMLARAYAELGEAAHAVETLLEIRRNAPDDLYVNYARAQIYMTSGDLLSAKAHIRKTLEQGISPIWYYTARFAKICTRADFADLRAERPDLCSSEISARIAQNKSQTKSL